MKLLGLLTVMAAALGLSLSYLKALDGELSCVRGLCLGVRIIRSELALSASPMRELLAQASARTNGDAAGFFRSVSEAMHSLDERSFAELWHEACGRLQGRIPAENWRELDELGRMLGRFELKDLLAACDRYLSKTEEWIGKNGARLPERRRLALALGAAGGSFLCLLML